MLERFSTLFRGGEYGWGTWGPKGGKTEHGQVPLEAYEKHLSGELGLGIVPVNSAGTVFFAAIDIDVNTIDHQGIYAKVKRRKMPLHVCRSKSGGAHLYLFSQNPLKAAAAREILSRCAAVLGYPAAEIFPKQTQIKLDNIGSWINLPYFGGDKTTRYCVSENGAMSLEEFLESVQYYDPALHIDLSVDTSTAQMPPCLAALSEHAMPEGARNQTLFNVAVFYRKSNPGDWENSVASHNQEKFKEPLPYREVQSVVKSAAGRKYQYTCDQFPIKDYCDRQACLKLPFGINNHTPKSSDNCHPLQVTNLRKMNSNPPTYILEVNGSDVKLSLDEFFSYVTFSKSMLAQRNLSLAPMKNSTWAAMRTELLDSVTEIETPEDASIPGMVRQQLDNFTALRQRALGRDDLLKHLPVTINDMVCFIHSDFKNHLHRNNLDVPAHELWQMFYGWGGDTHILKVCGKVIRVWRWPIAQVNEQTDDFASSGAFEKQFGDEL